MITPEILTKEQKKISLILEKNCDYLFKLYQNPSGYSQDVHGQVKNKISFNLNKMNSLRQYTKMLLNLLTISLNSNCMKIKLIYSSI